jgi:hypothetical protein
MSRDYCSVCNKSVSIANTSKKIFCAVCNSYRHLQCSMLQVTSDDIICTKCLSISLPFINIDNDFEYDLAVRGIDKLNEKLDLTKFITNNLRLELLSHIDDFNISDVNSDINADNYLNNLLNRPCDYHETPSLQSHIGTAKSLLHINARSLLKNQICIADELHVLGHATKHI